MRFEKWQALGNDYVIVEAAALPWELTPERVRRICAPHFGVGSDGILLLGAGCRPVVRRRAPDLQPRRLRGRALGQRRSRGGPLSPRRGLDRRGHVLGADKGRSGDAADHRARTRSRWRSGGRRPTSPDYPDGPADGTGTLASGGPRLAFRHVNVGNPQCVIEVGDEVESLDLAAIGPGIERNTGLFPNRTNVSFIDVDGSAVRARIFERGVGETLSSGTGASRSRGGGVPRRRAEPDHGPARRRRARGRDHGRARRDADRQRRTGLPRASSRTSSSRALARRRLASPAMALTDPSRRLEAIPPYMFAELERKVAEKKAAGIDVISLGIGDPDTPTYPHIVEAMQAGGGGPGDAPVPVEPRPGRVPGGVRALLRPALRRRDRPARAR